MRDDSNAARPQKVCARGRRLIDAIFRHKKVSRRSSVWLASHLDACGTCRDRYDTLMNMDRLFASGDAAKPTEYELRWLSPVVIAKSQAFDATLRSRIRVEHRPRRALDLARVVGAVRAHSLGLAGGLTLAAMAILLITTSLNVLPLGPELRRSAAETVALTDRANDDELRARGPSAESRRLSVRVFCEHSKHLGISGDSSASLITALEMRSPDEQSTADRSNATWEGKDVCPVGATLSFAALFPDDGYVYAAEFDGETWSWLLPDAEVSMEPVTRHTRLTALRARVPLPDTAVRQFAFTWRKDPIPREVIASEWKISGVPQQKPADRLTVVHWVRVVSPEDNRRPPSSITSPSEASPTEPGDAGGALR